MTIDVQQRRLPAEPAREIGKGGAARFGRGHEEVETDKRQEQATDGPPEQARQSGGQADRPGRPALFSAEPIGTCAICGRAANHATFATPVRAISSWSAR